jgi:hypothetical protein
VKKSLSLFSFVHQVSSTQYGSNLMSISTACTETLSWSLCLAVIIILRGEPSTMKIEFNDQGSVSVITVTSTVFEFRRHNRAVDVALLLTTEMTSQRSGFSL